MHSVSLDIYVSLDTIFFWAIYVTHILALHS